MNVIDVKQINKGAIKATFSLAFPFGLTIRECKLMEGKNGQWISFPSREYNDAEGKKRYYSYVVITEDKKPAFEQKCLELLKPHLTVSAPAVPPTVEDVNW